MASSPLHLACFLVGWVGGGGREGGGRGEKRVRRRWFLRSAVLGYAESVHGR